MRTIAILVCSVVALAVATAVPQRIVGGSATTIDNYPSMVSLIFSSDLVTFTHSCGATILTNRLILTAAECTHGHVVPQWRARVGSTYANSGGDIYMFTLFYNYPLYDEVSKNHNIGVCRTASTIIYGSNIQRVAIASANYVLPDDSSVWATGWGVTDPEDSSTSEVLNDVQVFTVNQAECRNRYATVNSLIADTMLCSGVLDVGGSGQCYGDVGGPLYHNGIVVGVSWGSACGDAFLPSINTRVSVYSLWISDQA